MQELRKTALRRKGTLGHLTKMDYLNGVGGFTVPQMNVPLEPSARDPHSDVSSSSSSSSSASSLNSNSNSAQQKPRLNRLANPFPDPSLATQIQPPILLSQPLPLPVQYQRPMEHLEIRRHYRLLCTLQQHSSSKN